MREFPVTISADAGFDARVGAQLEQLLRGIITVLDKPGAVLALDVGSARWRGAAGFAELSPAKPMAVGQPFRLGSITKMLVAEAALQAIEARHFDLQDRLSRWFPAAPNAAEITLQHLLRHQSGLQEYLLLPEFLDSMARTPGRIFQPNELRERAFALKPLFQPGESTAYSNTNYLLLTLLLEQAGGQPLQEILKRRLFQPLNLKNTFYLEQIFPGHIRGFTRNPESDVPRDLSDLHPSIVYGSAGGLSANVDDLIRLNRAVVNGELVGAALQRQRLQSQAIPPQRPIPPWWGQVRVGMGIQQVEAGYIGHYGAFWGYESCVFYHPVADISIAAHINLTEPFAQRIDLPAVFRACLEILDGHWQGCVGIYSRVDKTSFAYTEKHLVEDGHW